MGEHNEAKRSNQFEQIVYWGKCLSDLGGRKKWHDADQAEEVESSKHDRWCKKGFFGLEGGVMFFTNTSEKKCREIHAVCNFRVSTLDYDYVSSRDRSA